MRKLSRKKLQDVATVTFGAISLSYIFLCLSRKDKYKKVKHSTKVCENSKIASGKQKWGTMKKKKEFIRKDKKLDLSIINNQ